MEQAAVVVNTPNKKVKFTSAAKSAASVGTVATAPAPYLNRYAENKKQKR